MDINLKEFPITRYQGSKRKILPWIYGTLSELDLKYDTVLDAFGGTASISYLFKKMGKSVTYNDILRFNHIIGKALIENDSSILNDFEIEEILNHISSREIVQRQFENIFYLSDENKWIDDTVEGILELEQNEYKQAIAYYALFQSCLIKRPFNLFHRKNLALRINDVPRSFGNKTSWERPFPDLFKKFVTEANKSVINNGKTCLSFNESVFSFNDNHYDLVYLDPPYFSKNRQETSNYRKCYHFLEGLANYNLWEGMINQDSLIKKLVDENEIDEFNKRTINEKIEELLLKFRKSIIVISYKESGVPSIEFITNILKKIGKKVSIKSIHYKYALNHQNGDAEKNREVLIIAH